MKISKLSTSNTITAEGGTTLVLLFANMAKMQMSFAIVNDGITFQVDFFADEFEKVRQFFTALFAEKNRICRDVTPIQFQESTGIEFEMYRDNMGEPYRDGVTLVITGDGTYCSDFFEETEVRRFVNALQSELSSQ